MMKSRLLQLLPLLKALKIGVAALTFLATGALLAAAQSPGTPQSADSANVMSVARGFKRALLDGDSAKAISFLHANLSVFESRKAENLAEYRSGHLAADMAHLKTVTQATTKETLSISGDIAVYTSLYTSTGTSRGRQVNSNGTETMVLSRTPVGWKILHVHW
jgi:ketosteroid isomerase-like protein